MNRPASPKIIVHGSRALPLDVLVAAGCAIGGAIFISLRKGIFSREVGLVVLIAIIGGLLVRKRVGSRPVQLVIQTDGIDIVSQGTGLLRWEELVHVSLFTIPPDGADGLVVFVDESAAQRLPKGHNDDLPAFADVSLGTNYIVIYGRDLEYSLRDVLEEVNARRRGQCGPLSRFAE